MISMIEHMEISFNKQNSLVRFAYVLFWNLFGATALDSEKWCPAESQYINLALCFTNYSYDYNQPISMNTTVQNVIKHSTDTTIVPVGYDNFYKDFDYFGARYYDSDLSVWLSVDPLSDKYLSTSPFMYVLGNPIKFIDPNGMNHDYYQNKAGDVIHRDGHATTVTKGGEEYKNIGSTYSKENGDGTSTHYVQKTPVAITSSDKSFGEAMQNKKLFRNAIGVANQYSLKTVQSVYNQSVASGTDQMSQDALMLMGGIVAGVILLADGIISTEFWAAKAAISASTQAIMNNGDVDLADVAIGAVTTPGAGALLGGLVDVNSSGIQVTGYNKPLSQTVTDIGTGALSSKLGAKGFNSTKSFLNNGFERGMMNATMNVPTSVLGVGLNKAIKKP